MAGSVKKDGQTWYYVLELGKDSNGKRKQKKKRGFKTKKEAQNALTEAEHSLMTGTYIEPSKMLFKDYLNQWLEDKQTYVKESTLKNYRRLVKNHILPSLGHIEMCKLSPIVIQQLYNKLKSGGYMSDENIRKVHTIIKDSLNKAVKWDLINKNPASLVDSPKVAKSEINVWDTDEVKRLLDTTKSSRYYIAFLLAVTTGMRRGEILGLRWKDINFKDETLHVTQILSVDGKRFESGAKTRAGVRSISLPDETISELKKHKAMINQERLLARDIYNNHDLVVCTEIGTPCNPRNLLRTFNNAIEKASLTKLRFHDLRHTHATLLLKQGVNPKIVAERLGHSDVRMTLDTYSHLMPSMQKDTAKAFGKMLFGDTVEEDRVEYMIAI